MLKGIMKKVAQQQRSNAVVIWLELFHSNIDGFFSFLSVFIYASIRLEMNVINEKRTRELFSMPFMLLLFSSLH